MPQRSAAQAEREQRRLRVAAGLLQGLSQRDLARATSTALGTINADVKAIFARWHKEQITAVEDLRALQSRQLDSLINAVWSDAVGGQAGEGKPPTKASLAAVDRVLAIMERKARLFGLDEAPTDADGNKLLKAYVLVSPDDWPDPPKQNDAP